MARRGDHGDQGDELLEVDLQVSVLVEVSKQLIQNVILMNFLLQEEHWVERSRNKIKNSILRILLMFSFLTDLAGQAEKGHMQVQDSP